MKCYLITYELFCPTEKNQDKYSKCSTCGKEVQVSSMGKYCVRFGCYIKQFCSNACLEDHKKALKVRVNEEEGFGIPSTWG